jgi:predicted metal-dependent peptidase
MSARKRLSTMRTTTFEYYPYLATYVYSMRAIEKPGIKTLAVDAHGNMYYDPAWIESQTVERGAYGVVHEVCHVVFRHHERANEMYGTAPTEMQRHVCNVAADLVVEQALHAMRQHRPDGSVHLGMQYTPLKITLDFPPNLRMEEYYRLIMDRINSQSKEQGGPVGSGAGGEPDADGEGMPAPCNGGSAADGVTRDYEEEPDGAWESFGEDAAAQATEKAMEDAESKMPGSVPGSLREAVGFRSQVVRDPWGELKAAVATSVASPVGGRQSTYARPSRRQPPNMMRLRGNMPTAPNAVVVLDTSGSMCNPDDQAKALTCIAAGLRKLARFKVIAGDTDIASRKDVSSIAQVEWTGGGGTDMSHIVEMVDREERPDSIVLVTDCYTDWPERQTRARLVVACTTNRTSVVSRIPRWARTVVLAD